MSQKKIGNKEVILENNLSELNEYEKNIIDSYGKLWEMRGLYFIIGKIFGVLVLRAFKPQYGLTQESIAKFVNRSVSSVSRSLSSLLKAGKCHYIEVINENHHRERRYYVTLNLKELTIDQYKQIINQTIFFKERIQNIYEQMSENDKKDFLITSQFLQALKINLEKLIKFNENVMELSNQL